MVREMLAAVDRMVQMALTESENVELGPLF